MQYAPVHTGTTSDVTEPRFRTRVFSLLEEITTLAYTANQPGREYILNRLMQVTNELCEISQAQRLPRSDPGARRTASDRAEELRRAA